MRCTFPPYALYSFDGDSVLHQIDLKYIFLVGANLVFAQQHSGELKVRPYISIAFRLQLSQCRVGIAHQFLSYFQFRCTVSV
jgi:hypothetical protein